MPERQTPTTEAPPQSPGLQPLLSLSGDESAERALKRVHVRLLEAIVDNDEGVRDGLEGEYLHDFRVAIRRTRTALRQLKHVYAPEATERFSQEFAWLSKTTNAPRDLEVFLGSLDELCDGDAGPELDPLIGFLREHERRERAQCSEALASERYRRLMDEWRDHLSHSAADLGPQGAQPASEVAAARIDKAYARVVRHGRGLNRAAPAEAFHRVRLDCKKLRYLLEFFATLFDVAIAERIVLSLRGTQDDLGAINDLAVQREWVASAPPEVTEPASALVDVLEERQRIERRRFLEDFPSLTHDDTAATVRELLAAGDR